MNFVKDLRILFADDEIYSMRTTISALEARGATVDIVRDGTEVLEYCRGHMGNLPHVIVLDLMMAEGAEIRTQDEGRSTGVEVYRRLRRELNVQVPVIISTVVTDDRILANFETDKKVTVVRKPYQYEELHRKIEKVLHGHFQSND